MKTPQILSIIVPIAGMLFVQTMIWIYKFGKLEQKVTDQNGRIDRLENWKDGTQI